MTHASARSFNRLLSLLHSAIDMCVHLADQDCRVKNDCLAIVSQLSVILHGRQIIVFPVELHGSSPSRQSCTQQREDAWSPKASLSQLHLGRDLRLRNSTHFKPLLVTYQGYRSTIGTGKDHCWIDQQGEYNQKLTYSFEPRPTPRPRPLAAFILEIWAIQSYRRMCTIRHAHLKCYSYANRPRHRDKLKYKVRNSGLTGFEIEIKTQTLVRVQVRIQIQARSQSHV